MTVVLTPRNLIAACVLFLAVAALFGVLNNFKIKGLHDAMSNVTAQGEAAEIRRITQEKNLKARDALAAEANRKISEAESRTAKAEADLTQAQKEKADLQARMDTTEAEIVSLRKNIQELRGKPVSEMPGVPTSTEADAQMDSFAARSIAPNARRNSCPINFAQRSKEPGNWKMNENGAPQRTPSRASGAQFWS